MNPYALVRTFASAEFQAGPQVVRMVGMPVIVRCVDRRLRSIKTVKSIVARCHIAMPFHRCTEYRYSRDRIARL